MLGACDRDVPKGAKRKDAEELLKAQGCGGTFKSARMRRNSYCSLSIGTVRVPLHPCALHLWMSPVEQGTK